ncbi:AAA family ATPase [Frigidibacter sp. MR17.14]|uniref:AAA family ATPase n=1 Tax=Frigidibacter sp. MR17.14 TaxID=3126509 RepID=UPI003012EF8E
MKKIGSTDAAGRDRHRLRAIEHSIRRIVAARIAGDVERAARIRRGAGLALTPQMLRFIADRLRLARAQSQHVAAIRLALIHSHGDAYKFFRDRHTASADWTQDRVAREMRRARRSGRDEALAENLDEVRCELVRLELNDPLGTAFPWATQLRAAYLTDAVSGDRRLRWRAQQAELEALRLKEVAREARDGARGDAFTMPKPPGGAVATAEASRQEGLWKPMAGSATGDAVPDEVVKGTEKDTVKEAAGWGAGPALPPRHVRLHEASDLEGAARGSEEARLRWTLRQSLAKPQALKGPETRDAIDLLYARLFEESPWLRGPIEWMWQRHLDCLDDPDRALRLPPLLILGPPGCGKTHLAQRLAALSGTASARVDMSGAAAPWSVAGGEFGWRNAGPGIAVTTIARSGTANPLILLDEIEKAGATHAGDPLNALLPLLQPETARTFRCPWLEAPVDLSHLSWVLLGNGIGRLPAPLLDRLAIHEVGYPDGRDLRALVEHRLGAVAADPSVLETAARALKAGRLTLRGLGRIEAEFRRIDRNPRHH